MVEMIAQRYAVIENQKFRYGGQSVVKKAIDTVTGDPVAVKFLLAIEDDTAKRLFKRELRHLQALKHHNIVELLDFGEDEDGNPFLVLEWVDRSLKDYLATGERLTWVDFYTAVAVPLLEALSYVHLEGREHRDIKPANVLLDPDGSPKLADFGITKDHFDSGTDATAQEFRSGVNSPPELADSLKFVRDVYSIGLLIVIAQTEISVQDYPDIPAALESLEVPDQIRDLLGRCVDPNPSVRPPNAAVLLEELRASVADSKSQKVTIPTVSVRITRRASDELLGASAHGQTAERLFMSDVGSNPHVLYRWDHEKAERDKTQVILVGETLRFTLKLEPATGTFVAIGAKELDFDDIERLRSRGLECGAHLKWSTSEPLRRDAAALASAFVLELLDDFHQSSDGTRSDDELSPDGRALVERWRHLIQAREQLARGEITKLLYSALSLEGTDASLDVDPAGESDFVGTEWYIEGGAAPKIWKFRGEVIGQVDSHLRLRWRGRRPESLPKSGVLHPYLGPAQVALQRQLDAISNVEDRLGARDDLIDLLADPALARSPRVVSPPTWSSDLDEDKRTAVVAALGLDDFMIVKGPPGTGKTRFIAELTNQFLARNPESRVLIVSQTHAAVDNALERLENEGIAGLVRLGSADDQRVSVSNRHLLLEPQVRKWAKSVEVRAITHIERLAFAAGVQLPHLRAALSIQQLLAAKERSEYIRARMEELRLGDLDSSDLVESDNAEELIELASKAELLREEEEFHTEDAKKHLSGDLTLRPGLSTSELQSAVALLLGTEEAGSRLLELLKIQAEWLQRLGSDDNLAQSFLQTSKVVAGTCIGFLATPAARSLEIDLCILDEASKATSTEALVPIARAKRAILVGDLNQLPPLDEDLLRRGDLLTEFDLSKAAVKETLFQRLSDLLPSASQHALSSQYRMIKPIGDLISTCFYGGDLVSLRTQGMEGYTTLGREVLWIDTGSLGSKRRENGGVGAKGGFVNHVEVKLAIDRLKAIDGAIKKRVIKVPKDGRLSVLVIAPYRSQVEELRRRVAESQVSSVDVSVESVDAVQGREADFAIFTVTRSNSGGGLGFLAADYWRRINVALSRARFGLTIIGDANFCEQSGGALRDVVRYVRENSHVCDMRQADA